MNHLKNIKNYNKNKFDIIGFSASIADFLLPIKYSPNHKYNYIYIFTCLFDFTNNCTSCNKYQGLINFPINGRYLNQIHNKLVNNHVYEEINKQLLNKYFKTNKEKYKYQMIDSSFIQNKGGSKKTNNYLLNDDVKEKKNH